MTGKRNDRRRSQAKAFKTNATKASPGVKKECVTLEVKKKKPGRGYRFLFSKNHGPTDTINKERGGREGADDRSMKEPMEKEERRTSSKGFPATDLKASMDRTSPYGGQARVAFKKLPTQTTR